MNALNAATLLDVWERGRMQAAPQRAVLMLSAAQPEQSATQLAALSIGQRDAQLLTLRAATFGPHAVSLAACPQCRRCLQIDLNLDELHATPSDYAATWILAHGEIEIAYRLPNSLDLIAVGQFDDIGSIRRALLERCLTQITIAGQPFPIADLPPDVLDAIEADMARRDPQAQVQLDLTCPHCGHEWSVMFDIASFFWGEINARAAQLLYDVHTLASAYGWREADILAMSTVRRQAYLDLIEDEMHR